MKIVDDIFVLFCERIIQNVKQKHMQKKKMNWKNSKLNNRKSVKRVIKYILYITY